jgi:hypothetical protein
VVYNYSTYSRYMIPEVINVTSSHLAMLHVVVLSMCNLVYHIGEHAMQICQFTELSLA